MDARLATQLSKKMSWTLRHGAQKVNLAMRKDGFVKVTDMLALPSFARVSFDDIKYVASTDAKSRYKLIQEGDEWMIRANQGHTMQGVVEEEALLTKVESPDEFEVCIHGTYHKFMDSILQNGLSRMSRNHIHFAAGRFGEVASGMRYNAEVMLYLDLARAMKAGIPFFRSENGVILSPGAGDTGKIPASFLSKIEIRVPHEGVTEYQIPPEQ